MNDIQIFNFQSNEIRTILKDNEPWFVAKDICDVLGLGNITEALRNLDDDELTSEILKSGNQGREMKLVSESGLYALVIRSNKPNARKFRKWITSEVLPNIRKSGIYIPPVSGSHSSDVLMSTIYAEMERRIKAEVERDEYKRNLARIARASNLAFGEISAETGLPKDIVVAAHCKSCRKPHKPQLPKYIQLVLPMREILEECRAIEAGI